MFRTTIPFLVLLLTNIDAQVTDLSRTIEGCTGRTVDFNWTYNTSSPVFSLEWKVNGSRIALQVLTPPSAFTPIGSYSGRLTLSSNAQVSLASLSASDVGAYACEVTYTDNSGFSSTESILHVYDELNNKTEIIKTPGNEMVTLKPSFFDSSITYTWKLQGDVISTGSSYDAKLDGNYTLCISGGRANCLNPTISACDSIEVSGLSRVSTTVSEVPPPLVTTSSAGLSQEIVIIITISSIIAAGVLIFLTVLVVNLCRHKNRQMPAKKPKENRFATKQGKFTKKDVLKSPTEPRIKLSGKRNTKQESISLDKFEHTQFNNSQALKDRMYEHNPQTTDYTYLNNIQNQHVFNHSYAGRNMIPYGNQHDSYPKSHSRPNHNQLYQSCYPEHPGQKMGMFQYYRADNLYQGQQMYQRPYDALYDSHIIGDKQDDNRSSKGRAYEKNWDLLY